MRYDRVGCQLYPGSSGVHTTVDPSSIAASRRPLLTTHARGEDPIQDTDRSYVFGIKPNLPSTKPLKTCDIVSHRNPAEMNGPFRLFEL
jgi:hypothetical protein